METDRWHEFLKIVGSYNRYLALGAVLFALFAGWLIAGCSPRTASVKDPTRQVTQQEFIREVDSELARLKGQEADLKAEQVALMKAQEAEDALFGAKVERHNIENASLGTKESAGLADIAAKIETRKAVVNIAGVVAQQAIDQAATGTLNPIGLVSSLVTAAMGLLGGGALLDAQRRKVLTTSVAASTQPTSTPSPPAESA